MQFNGIDTFQVMAKENLSAVLHGVNDLRLENRPIPEVKDNEVLVHMACVGICGSDVHFLSHGRIGDYIVEQPMVIGHEASGVVEMVGAAVTSLKPGDRVAIEPGVPCRECSFCKHGVYNVCPKMGFCACPPHHGNLSRYFSHASDFCYKLPAHVSLEEGALLEPLAVGVHACRRAGVMLGSTVLIIGAGPIGLVSLITAKAMGANKVIITDIVQNRLKIAKSIGADFTLLAGTDDEVSFVTQIRGLLGTAPDIALECSGAEAGVRIAILAVRCQGVVQLVGMGAPDARVPLLSASLREVDIRTTFRYCNDYPIALAMVASRKVDVKQLITHNYKLEETLQAFETARTGVGNPIKVMIHCS